MALLWAVAQSDKSDKSAEKRVFRVTKVTKVLLFRVTPEESGPGLPCPILPCPVYPGVPCSCTPSLGTPRVLHPGYTMLPWVHPALPGPWLSCPRSFREASGKPPGSPESSPKADRPRITRIARIAKSGHSGRRADAAGRSRPAASRCPVRTLWAQARSTAWVAWVRGKPGLRVVTIPRGVLAARERASGQESDKIG